jgi:hypothetical protein
MFNIKSTHYIPYSVHFDTKPSGILIYGVRCCHMLHNY